MNKKMKAAVAVEEGEIEVQEKEIPSPEKNEVRIRGSQKTKIRNGFS